MAFGKLLNDWASPIKKSLHHPKADPEKRSIYCQKLQKYINDKRPIISIDESGFAHDMPRTHGYSKKGQRCYGKHDWGAKGRTNVIGALLNGALLTVSMFTSSINTEIFNAWIAQDLVPKLPPQSVIIMDNASFHKGASMVQFIENSGHTLLYLPPYSPDLNPIEQKWAQAKALRRKEQCHIHDLFLHYNL